VNPIASAIDRHTPIRSPKNRNAISVVKGTVIALAIAPIPAGARCAAHAKRMKGSAELIAPISATFGHSAKGNFERACQRNGNSTNAPSPRRTSTSAIAPKSSAATRMNKKDAPQIAPSTTSSSGVGQACSRRGGFEGGRSAVSTRHQEEAPRHVGTTFERLLRAQLQRSSRSRQ
jgi:hypothetical protein